MKALLLLVVLAGAVGAGLYFFVFDKATPSSDARIVSVSPRLTGTASATTVVVDVEIEAAGAMPPVGPHVIVTATCDGQRDDVIGDVGLMNNAAAGDHKTDAVELFTNAPFDSPPARCSITARTSDGAASASACLELGTARAGGC
jgi:hypothetical protein